MWAAVDVLVQLAEWQLDSAAFVGARGWLIHTLATVRLLREQVPPMEHSL